MRAFIKTTEDCYRFVSCLAAVMVIVGVAMAYEKKTSINIVSTLATGVLTEASVRDGRVRAEGAFMHPILAGSIGAAMAVLMPLLIRAGVCTRLAKAGFIASIVVVLSSASSGPVIALAAGIAALYLWHWRIYVRRILVAFLLSVVGLHILMKAPVWYLLARIDLAGGSTGNHRAELITQAINHVGDWWLIGADYTRDWFPYGVEWSADTADITNYYIRMGVTGGLPLLFLFLAILSKSFGMIGRQLKSARKNHDPHEFAIWCIGASLFAHCVAFISISYFDQSDMVPFWLIGLLPALSTRTRCFEPGTGDKQYSAKENPGEYGGTRKIR